MAKNLLPVTALESAVLALIWRRGPCSSYVVMRAFRASPTPEWSASTGAIYPAIARLEAKGLIVAEEQEWGRKGKKVFRVTQPGAAAVRLWVSELSESAGQVSPDMTRTRMHFLDALESDAARLACIREAEQRAAVLLSELQAQVDALVECDPTEARALEGAVYAVRARLDWLRHMRSGPG